MTRPVVLCACLLLLCWAETAAGELREVFMDPARGGPHNGIALVAKANPKQAPVPARATHSTRDWQPAEQQQQQQPLTDPILVHVSASTLTGLRCKPVVCTYDSARRNRAHLRGNDAWSLAPVSAGVFADKDAEHYLHLVKVCHSIKGAYAASSVKGSYTPETGKVQLLLRFPQSATLAVSDVVSHGAPVSDRISALLADAVIMQGAPVVVDKVTVQQLAQSTGTPAR